MSLKQRKPVSKTPYQEMLDSIEERRHRIKYYNDVFDSTSWKAWLEELLECAPQLESLHDDCLTSETIDELVGERTDTQLQENWKLEEQVTALKDEVIECREKMLEMAAIIRGIR